MRREEGSALITVIMVVLVLTMVGLAITYFMQVEDKTSGNDLRMKQALYAAEVGLRTGERALVAIPGSSYSALASPPAGGDTIETLAILQAGQNPHIPIPPDPLDRSTFDIHHLGTYLRDAGITYANVDVGTTTLPAKYSLMVRISKGSLASTRIQLVCAGWVEDSSGLPVAVKILAEEYGQDAAASTNSLPQKGGGAGGTNATSITR